MDIVELQRRAGQIATCGLTSPQGQVLGLLVLGGSISQLAALLQTDQYDLVIHAGIPPSPYGGFLDV